MMRNLCLITLLLFIWSCNDTSLSENEETPTNVIRLSHDSYNSSTFLEEIQTLSIGIFQKTNSNFYRLVFSETLNSTQLAALESDANSNLLYKFNFTEGDFLIGFMGNYTPQLNTNSTPNDMALQYPTDGLQVSYFTAYQEISLSSKVPQTFNVTLTRVIANPYVVIGYIPTNVSQIDFQVINFAATIDILGNFYGNSQSPTYSWIDPNTNPTKVRFTVFSILCFPSAGTSSAIRLTIYYRDGSSEIKDLPVTIAPNEYLSLFVSFNSTTSLSIH